MESLQKYGSAVTTIAELADNLQTKKDLAAIFIKSGLIPNQLNTPEKVLVAMFKCQELGLPPLEGMAGMAIINGKVTLQGNLILAMINRSGKAKKITIKDSETGCTVTMSRRDYELEYSFTFSLEDAKKAKLTDKAVWKEYLRTMLKWRAVSGCARVVFPDIIGGLYTPEEIASITNDEITIDSEENIIIKETPGQTQQIEEAKEVKGNNEIAKELFEPELNQEYLDKLQSVENLMGLTELWNEIPEKERSFYTDKFTARKTELKKARK